MTFPIFKSPLFSLTVKSSSSVWKEEDLGEGAGCLLKKLLGKKKEVVRGHRQE